MIYLLLCILCSSTLIFIFKYCSRLSIPVVQLIFINYVVCALLGVLVLPGGMEAAANFSWKAPWLWAALAGGTLFFTAFFLIAESARTAGVAITSVAQKVSLVVPVAASLLFWNKQQSLGPITLAGLALAVVAVVLSSWPRNNAALHDVPKAGLLARSLPVLVFLIAGIADTLINFANFKYLSAALQVAFTMGLFGTAAILSFLVLVYRLGLTNERFDKRSLLAGIVLGVPNLFSLIFLLKALSAFDNNGAFVYPVNNMGVIMLSAIGGIILFRERLRSINWIGLGLALVALALLLVKEVVN